MTLPTNRLVTLAPSSAIPSALLNLLQDCIIGMKYPTITHPISPGSWLSEGAGGKWTGGAFAYAVGTGKWTSSGFDDITVGISLPVGTVLRGATFNFNRTSGTLNFKIQKKLAGAGAWTDIVTVSDAATVGAAVKTLSCAETIAVDTAYRLYLDSSAVATFDVANYTHDRL